MTTTVREAHPGRARRGAALFLFGLLLAMLASAYAVHVRLAALDTWLADPEAHFADGVPAMVTADAYYGLRWAAAVHERRFVAHADDPLRHFERLQYPVGTSEYLPGDAPLDWRPQRTPRRLPLLSATIAAVAPFAQSVDWAALRLTPVLAGLFVLPLFVYAWRVGQPAAGLLGGLVGAFAPAYFSRTQLGYVDTDCLNLFFPWLAALLILSIDRQARTARLLVTAAALGLTLYLYYRWYDKAGLSALYWGALGLHLAVQRRGVRSIALALAVCIACSHPIQAAHCVDDIAGLAGRYLLGSRPADGLSGADALFPNVMATVAEQRGGRGLAALPGILGHPAPAILGLLGFAGFAIRRWRECIPLLPLITMAAFTFLSGPRFSMYLAPFVGFGLGLLVSEAVRLAVRPQRAAADSIACTVASHLACVLVFALWLGPVAARATPATSIAISAPTIRAVHKAARVMPAGAPVWTWWDHGFAYAHLAGWSVFHDGGAQYTPQTHVIAHGFVDTDQRALHTTMANVDRIGNRGISALAARLHSRVALLQALAQPAPDAPAARELFVVYTEDMRRVVDALRHVAGESGRGPDGAPIDFEWLPCTAMRDRVLVCRGFDVDLETGVFSDGRGVRRLDVVDNGQVVERRDYPRGDGRVLQLMVDANRRIDAVLVPDALYQSNLNRMFLLGEYDRTLFEEVYREMPLLRVFRRKPAAAARP